MNYPKPLATEIQNKLAIEAKYNNEAKEKLILHNQRLVHHIAKKYCSERTEIEDLFQSGIIGLMKAIDKYDPGRGAGFTTAAVWYIKSSIMRNILNIGENESLEAPLPGTEDIFLKDIVYDITENSIEEDYEINELRNEIRELIDKHLNDLEKKIVFLKYGFNGMEYKISDISQILNITVNQVNSNLNNIRSKLYRTKYIQEKKIDSRTPFYRSIDYSQPKTKSSNVSSPVEQLVLYREQLRERLSRRKNTMS